MPTSRDCRRGEGACIAGTVIVPGAVTRLIRSDDPERIGHAGHSEREAG